MTTDPPRLMTVKEACAFLRRGRCWVLEHADELGAIRYPGRLLFPVKELLASEQRRQVRAVAPAATPKPPTRVRADLPSLADFAARRRVR